MFQSQHRVTRSPLSITPRTDTHKKLNLTRPVTGKGKAVAFSDDPPPPPPLGLLNEDAPPPDGGDMNDWRMFKEAGFLDEAVMEKKDHEALVEKIARLEKELYDYQYNMGLLLMENKKLTETTEKLREALAEKQEIIKREEAAHLMAVSEVEKRADNLRKALEYEKRCQADLEKALREIDEENKQIKLSSQTSLADANTLVAEIGDKAREVEEKMRQADAKLAEANKKGLEVERRMQELETHESLLQSERQTFIAGQEAWKDTYSKHKKDLVEWENKLQDGEERLCEGRRIINMREEKINEIERLVKQKQKELEEAHNKIDSSILDSKKKEDDINKRLMELIAKEEQAESVTKNLEIKEKKLLDLTQKLTKKEKVEIQKLLDAHKDALDCKRREFDLEMEEKRKSIENEMRNKVEAVEHRMDEINHKEEKLRKQEQALDKKSERFSEKEKEIDLKSKALKEKEKSYQAEAKSLETDKKQLLAEIERWEDLKANAEKIRDEITQKELRVHEDIEKLKITEDERTNYSRLQLELKNEIEKCRAQKELIMKEIDDLKTDRLKFEQEWEALDEKKSVITKEIREFSEERESWEKQRVFVEEKLEKMKSSTKEYVDRELNGVQIEKETFAATMKHEESLLIEKYENEHRQFLHDFEQRKRDHEVDLQKKRTELEQNMQEKERAFEELRGKELRDIGYLKEVTRKDLEEVKLERSRIDKVKNEIAVNSQRLEENQLELRKDIDLLGVLSKKINSQREEFTKERNRFLEFVEKLKNCGNCGEVTRSYQLSDLHIPGVKDDSSLPRTVNEVNEKSESILATNLKSPSSGGLASWLKKSVSTFKLTPHREMGHKHNDIPESSLPIDLSNVPAGPRVDIHAQKEPSEVAKSQTLPLASDDQSYMGSKNLDVPESSQQSEMRSSRRTYVRKPKVGARKSHTVLAVSEDGIVNGNPESPQASSYAEKRAGPATRKRAHAETSIVSGSEIDGGDSEVQSVSITTVGRRKRRQTVAPPVETPGVSRYNLRRPKTGDVISRPQASTGNRGKNLKKEISGANDATQKREIASALDTQFGSEDGSTALVHVSTSKTVETQILDTTFKTPGDVAGSSAAIKVVKNTEIVEEVTVTPESQKSNNEESDDNSDNLDDESEEDDGSDGDGDAPHPGEVSIGKKLWTFLST
uniref:protein CROWDED NUCLEI 2-like n=1 Tax=Erigeron canadensis TaxID=72917 RepID=UPI001CB8ED10|nr:protein CROWDED NUCLEI 2-like [Erigeron canadensis]